MATPLADALADLRVELKDAASAIWSDAELTRAIEKALEEFSKAIPYQNKTTVVTVAGSRDISISALTGRINVRAVEWPVGSWPQNFVGFAIWGNTLTMLTDAAPAAIENTYVYWEGPHTLGASSTTLDVAQIELVLIGAAGYACLQEQVDATDSLNTGGQRAATDWEKLAAHYLGRFQALLRKRQKLRTRRLYTETDPVPSQSSDPGP